MSSMRWNRSRLVGYLLTGAIAASVFAPHATARTARAESTPVHLDGAVPDAGLDVLFGPTAIEAAWAVIRYAPQPGLELMFSRLYPRTASR